MRVRKIGQWEETRVSSGHDHGLYLEAADIPAKTDRSVL